MTLLKKLRNTTASLAACMLLMPSINASAASLDGIPSGTYNVDITHASVVWKVSHFGFSNYVGRFNDFSNTLNHLITNKMTKLIIYTFKMININS